MSYTLEIDPKGIEKLIAKTGAIGARDTLSRAVTAGGAFLQTWIIENRLTGPRPQYLGVKSGRLRSSITMFNSLQDRDGASVRIGTNVEYARIHEFGFHDRVQVPGHIRRLKKRITVRRISAIQRFTESGMTAAAHISFRKRKIDIRLGYAHVKPFTKFMSIPERPFLRPAVTNIENRESVKKIIEKEIRKAIKEA